MLYNVGGGISRTDATILITLFVAFIGYTIYMGKKGTQEPILELETYNIKATILENKDYEFSKYYVSNIKQISKELVKYN